MVQRGASGLCGILLLDKPSGMTSHDVVAVVRRATGEKRVGHAGTLDPAATGLLVVLVGPATRLEPYLSSARKSYRATITFGTATDTDDAEGAVVSSRPVASDVFDPIHAEEVLSRFLGASLQKPPAYSAIKLGGVTAHRAARAGEPLELALRPIEVFEARLEAVDPEALTWDVSFQVSKGTYIRALARDIGESVLSAAHLSGLRRTGSGHLVVESARSTSDVVAVGAAGIEGLFVDPIDALGGLPIFEADCDDVGNGRSLSLPPEAEPGSGQLFAVVCANEFRALYRVTADRLSPEVVLATGIRRVP